MTGEKFTQEMYQIYADYYFNKDSSIYDDRELAHRKADELLCKALGDFDDYEDAIVIYNLIPKWYS